MGTLSGDDDHLHITLGTEDGSTIGGHVMGDLIIFTTAEVVIGECVDLQYGRADDAETGFPELTINKRQK